MVREEIVNGRARRHYAITPDGRSAQQAEAVRLSQAAPAVLNPRLIGGTA